MLHLHIDTHQY